MKKCLIFLHTLKRDETGLSRSIRYAKGALERETIKSIYFNYGSIKSYLGLFRTLPKPDWILFNGIGVISRHWLGILFLRLCCKTGIPVFLYWHETDWALRNSFNWWPKNTPLMLDILRKSNISHLVTSRRSAAFVKKALNTSDARVEVVYECIPDSYQTHDYDDGQFEFEDDKCVVAAIGSIQPRKGTDIFIETAEKVLCEINSVRFVWAGSGEKNPEYLAKCEQKISDSGFKNKILLAGYVKPVYSLLRRADIVFIPSRDDPMPLTGLEAMSFEKTVVCFDVGGLPEAMAGTGYVIPEIKADNAAMLIIDLINSKNFRKRPEARKAFLDKFTPELFAERLARILIKA